MSYQVLARKWRPRIFSELVGQQHVVQALVNALDANRLHHAYLFTGTRGVGKTTIGRIFAKSLNCEKGVTSTPCGACSACVQIDQGRFIDLIEVDAASRTKVEDTRELLDNVQYAPSVGQYKVYLIDEVHMLSNHSFNALLKTLEEPPPHVKFILATTDPQKLPVTILSRCLQFNLKRIPVQQIHEYLHIILGKEAIAAESAAVLEIARAADGSMRDGLSLLDQAIAHGAGQLKADEVRAMLGTVEAAAVDQLVQSLIAADVQGLLDQVQQIASQSPDYLQLVGDLLGFCQQMALAQLAPNNLHDQIGNRERILQLASQISAEEIQLFYQLLLLGKRDLLLAPDAASGFEMLMLRLLAFRPLETSKSAMATALAPKKVAPPAAPTKQPPPPTTPAKKAAAPVVSAASVIAPAKISTQEKMQAPQMIAPVLSAPMELPKNPSPALEPAVNKLDRNSSWADILRGLDMRGLVQQLAENSLLEKTDANHWRLIADATKSFLLTDSNRKKLIERLQQQFGSDLQIQISSGKIEGETPAMEQQRKQDLRQQSAQRAIEEDPHVKQMQEVFGAKFNADSIEPVD